MNDVVAHPRADCDSKNHHQLATVNPCTLCAPLGAVLAAAGVEGAMPLLHGAQGCATYIRRYVISHFREPIDVASSSFTEQSAVFGGESDFARALDNIRAKYEPRLVAVGTTCLAETIGEDMRLMVQRYNDSRGTHLPVIHASTASYRDGHVEGYHSMVRAFVRDLVEPRITKDEAPRKRINLLPPIVTPADLRHLRELVAAFGLDATILPDFSARLDAPILTRYQVMPAGGTKLDDIRKMGQSKATADLTLTGTARRASDFLNAQGATTQLLGLPIGVEATDAFLDFCAIHSGNVAPEWLEAERGRLLDAYADGHKYVYGKRIAIYGDPELVVAVANFLVEIGSLPVLCATGARNRALESELKRLGLESVEEVLEDTDFATIEERCQKLGVELMIGSSKGYRTAHANGIPLLRLGFPIHDRIGASRILSLGYRGTAWLFDSLVNTLLEKVQDASPIGFSYL
jgi:nitrogenase molybdenum-iron protein NifN